MGPGEELYSCAGHACFRLECPTFKLDYCFSYEGETVSGQVFRFFAGKLKMGMFHFPTAEFLKQYESSGRGVWQYRLNLPPDAKQRLWKILDDAVARGADLPYDYIKRGCAQSSLENVLAAITPYPVVYPRWLADYDRSRREILADYISSYSWTIFLLHTITGPEADFVGVRTGRIITPHDLVRFLRDSKIGGKPIIENDAVQLLPHGRNSSGETFFTPLKCAWILFALSVLFFFSRARAFGWPLIASQAAIALLVSYVVCFSSLPASNWNWLLIPFNPLPFVFWKWRRRWAAAFAVLLFVWDGAMLAAPHSLTDSAYLVFVAALALVYSKIGGFSGFGLAKAMSAK